MTSPVYPLPVPVRAREHAASTFERVIPDESELTAAVRIDPGRAYGFLTDTSLCIGCKACEVACKMWNRLPAEESRRLGGSSYDNTRELGATTWRHVAFVEQVEEAPGCRATLLKPFQSHWLMMSDVCKHCRRAGCLEACPTGALFRTEFGTVVVQDDICNGCAYCVPACPFGVVELAEDGRARKCTLCYDRLKGGLEPACAKTCPTNAIQFGPVDELVARARKRVARLHAQGVEAAYLYGVPGSPGATGGIEQLYCFFLLLDRPEVYNLPVAPQLPAKRIPRSLGTGVAAAAGLAAAAILLMAEAKQASHEEVTHEPR